MIILGNSRSTSTSGLNSDPPSLRAFSFSNIKRATNNFSSENKLGEGGFGGVYRGVIQTTEDPHKTIDVAVKQLSKRGFQASLLLLY